MFMHILKHISTSVNISRSTPFSNERLVSHSSCNFKWVMSDFTNFKDGLKCVAIQRNKQ